MWTSRFDPRDDTIWVLVHLFGPRGDYDFRFILDTGTPVTTIDPGVVDSLGYSARMAKGRSRSVGMGGSQSGYILEISRLDAMGFSSGPIDVACADLPGGLGIDGLIGTDLLTGRVVTLDWVLGLLSVRG